jgi:ankyrin repeat protein
MKVAPIIALLVSLCAFSQCGCRLKLREESWHQSCLSGDTKKLKALIASGLSPNAKDENGNTPLTCALIFERWETADYQISVGARVSEKNNRGDTVIEAVQSSRHSDNDGAWLKKHGISQVAK